MSGGDFHGDNVTILHGDAWTLAETLDPQSVHCIVTSPPYWKLRDYGVEGQFGLEKTPEEYIEKLVDLFRRLRPALRDDGTVWLNLGDCYAESFIGGGYHERHRDAGATAGGHSAPPGFKPKDLLMLPHRCAIALQADGWYVRMDVVWNKPNPMPESVTDRPTRAHEYLFILSKSDRYYYDAEAIREEAASADLPQPAGWDTGEGRHGSVRRDGRGVGGQRRDKQRGHSKRHAGFNDRWDQMTKEEQAALGRNKRSVWTVATQPFPEAHFATFPPKLIEPCIKAGTSERGVCPECGAPWRRIVVKTTANLSNSAKAGNSSEGKRAGGTQVRKGHDIRNGPTTSTETVGWERTCDHDLEPVRATVLDPFMGSGTTAAVARSLGRRAIGFELSTEYILIAAVHRRLAQGQLL